MNYTYPKSYKVKTLRNQRAILSAYFDLPMVDNIASSEGEGYFLIPHWKHLGTYNQAVEKVLGFIEESREFTNYRKGKLTKNHLCQSKEKESWWKTQGNYAIIPAQFGELHKGKSVDTVRKEKKSEELLLGAYEVAIMLLTHPERFEKYEDLGVDCPGDEYSPNADGDFSRALNFYWNDGRLEFYCLWTRITGDRFGSASGFLGSQPLETRPLDTFEPLNLESALKIVIDSGEYVLYKKLD